MKKLCQICAVLVFTAAAPLAVAKENASPDTIVVATMGDTLGPRHPVSLQNPEFAKLVALIRGADVAFANAELNTTTPEVSRLYKDMGIDLMSKANNHSLDGRDQNLLARAVANLDAVGMIHGGSGLTEAEARGPVFFDSPKGRVAMIATASTFQPDAAVPSANPSGTTTRRGISVLRNQRYTLVPPETMATLDRIGALTAFDGDSSYKDNQDLRIGNTIFRESDRMGITFEMNADDRAATLDAIRHGRESSTLALFSIHAHETQGGMNDPAPADFLQPLFHSAIDAGADVVVRTGPHPIYGIELYRGKPIFYGMGSIFYGVGINGNRRFGSGMYQFAIEDSWFDSAIALSTFKNGQLSEIRIYPLTVVLGAGPMASSMRIATGADAQRILTKLQRDSAAFGTKVEIRGDIGLVRGPKA